MNRTLWILALTLAAAPATAADDKEKTPVERTTNDRQILDMLADLHDKGAALYDTGDTGGCYRLFQGGLTAVRILLPKEIQKDVDAGLADAGRLPATPQRAMLLHQLIEDVRKKLHKTAGPKVKGALLHPPRPVGSSVTTPDPLAPPNPDKPAKIDAPVGPPVVPVNTPSKGSPAPVSTAPPSDDPPAGPKLPFTPIIPKPDGK